MLNKTKIKKSITFTIAMSFIFFFALNGNAQTLSYTPGKLTYSGYLCDDAGEPINGTQTMQFSIYTDSTGGTDEWHSNPLGISVNNGFFSVILSEGTPGYIQDVFTEDYEILYLQITINWEVLEPRQEITSVPASISTSNWNGGYVNNEIMIDWNNDITFRNNDFEQMAEIGYYRIRFYPFNSSNDRSLDINGDYAPEIRMQAIIGGNAVVNNQLSLVANTNGDSKLHMATPTWGTAVTLNAEEDEGGGAYFKLEGPAAEYTWDTNIGKLIIKNSKGEVTFEFDAETGNIYYSGQLIRR